MQIAFRRIMAATDYSPSAMVALNYACAIANKFGAELHVLHVMEEPLHLAAPEGVWLDPQNVMPALIRNATIFLGERTEHLRLEPTVQAVRAVRVGSPSEVIKKYATEQGVDLVVLGTRGNHGLSRLIMGSVAEKTVRLATCPVLTTHCSPGQGESDSPINIQRILVATDFSPAANRARDLALSLATKFGAELRLLNVVAKSSPLPDPEGRWIQPEYDIPVSIEEASRKLAENVAVIEANSLRPIKQEVMMGYPIEVIERYATDHKVDLIVLGTQGHRGLSHLLLGSVAEKIVRLASCPVLTTH